MTEEGGVHGIQCGKKRAPGVVTFCVVGDDMFGQGRFVQIGCIAQGAFLNKRKRLRNRYTVTRACANIYLEALFSVRTQVHNAFLQAINTFMQAVNAFMCAA